MIQEQFRKELFTLPNQLTLLRIILIPFIIILMVENTPSSDVWAGVIFILASLTDLVDGWIARKRGMVSKIGILVDPMADKLLVISALIILIHQDKIDPFITVIIIWREFGILTLRSIASSAGLVISASRLAKHKTLLQVLGIPMIIIGRQNEILGLNWFSIGYALIFVSLFVSVLSGLQYLRDYIRKVYSS